MNSRELAKHLVEHATILRTANQCDTTTTLSALAYAFVAMSLAAGLDRKRILKGTEQVCDFLRGRALPDGDE